MIGTEMWRKTGEISPPEIKYKANFGLIGVCEDGFSKGIGHRFGAKMARFHDRNVAVLHLVI